MQAPDSTAVAPQALAALLAQLDAQALARLRDLDPGDRNGLLLRVLRTFDSSMRRLCEQAARARADGDTESLRLAAHTLKSSAASIGALPLSALCAQIEAKARTTPVAELGALVDAMMAQCEGLEGLLAAVRA